MNVLTDFHTYPQKIYAKILIRYIRRACPCIVYFQNKLDQRSIEICKTVKNMSQFFPSVFVYEVVWKTHEKYYQITDPSQPYEVAVWRSFKREMCYLMPTKQELYSMFTYVYSRITGLDNICYNQIIVEYHASVDRNSKNRSNIYINSPKYKKKNERRNPTPESIWYDPEVKYTVVIKENDPKIAYIFNHQNNNSSANPPKQLIYPPHLRESMFSNNPHLYHYVHPQTNATVLNSLNIDQFSVTKLQNLNYNNLHNPTQITYPIVYPLSNYHNHQQLYKMESFANTSTSDLSLLNKQKCILPCCVQRNNFPLPPRSNIVFPIDLSKKLSLPSLQTNNELTLCSKRKYKRSKKLKPPSMKERDEVENAIKENPG